MVLCACACVCVCVCVRDILGTTYSNRPPPDTQAPLPPYMLPPPRAPSPAVWWTCASYPRWVDVVGSWWWWGGWCGWVTLVGVQGEGVGRGGGGGVRVQTRVAGCGFQCGGCECVSAVCLPVLHQVPCAPSHYAPLSLPLPDPPPAHPTLTPPSPPLPLPLPDPNSPHLLNRCPSQWTAHTACWHTWRGCWQPRCVGGRRGGGVVVVVVGG